MNFRFLVLLIFVLFNSCYSFTGSSLDPRIKTIKISRFSNYAALQDPNYAQEFTNDLQLRFQQRTNLSLTNEDNADILIEGEIVDFYEKSVNISSGDKANQNRLTINIRVNYINSIQPEKNFNKTFSHYQDYDASQSLTQVMSNITPEINTIIIDQIFNAIVADW